MIWPRCSIGCSRSASASGPKRRKRCSRSWPTGRWCRCRSRAAVTRKVLRLASDRPLEPGKVRELAPGSATCCLPRPLPPRGGCGNSTANERRRCDEIEARRLQIESGGNRLQQRLVQPAAGSAVCALSALCRDVARRIWYVYRTNSGGGVPPIPVTFAVTPDAAESGSRRRREAALGFVRRAPMRSRPACTSSRSVKRDSIQATQKIEVSAEKKKFAVQLEPIIKYVDVR